MNEVKNILISVEDLTEIIKTTVEAALKPKEVEHDLMKVPEAAAFLGCTIPTLYSKISRREIPFSKFPGQKRVFFSRQTLTDFLHTNSRIVRAKNRK
jgi:excisionase family DNA binding protein